MDARQIREFQRAIWRYFRSHGRNLPWRKTRDPYCILISEIMLQQTQVERVIPKYRLFIKKFPNFRRLARASLRQVLKTWQGLGYNRRVLFLKKLSEIIAEKYGGKLSRDPNVLAQLPGVGSATAGAVAAFAFGMPASFIETNIRRVFIHFFFPKKRKVNDEEILALVGRTVDRRNPREWYWALLDYGAMLGERDENPNVRSSRYRRQPPFKGSRRELRGKIVKLLTAKRSLRPREFAKELSEPIRRVEQILQGLEEEGFVRKLKQAFTVR